jgi:hypothetical protein
METRACKLYNIQTLSLSSIQTELYFPSFLSTTPNGLVCPLGSSPRCARIWAATD